MFGSQRLLLINVTPEVERQRLEIQRASAVKDREGEEEVRTTGDEKVRRRQYW